MYDSHTHLTSNEVSSELEAVFERFVKAGGKGLLNVAFDMNSNYDVLKLHKEFNFKIPIQIQNSLGIHPEVFYPNNEIDKPITTLQKCTSSLDMVKNLVERNLDVVSAIGETGLDYLRIKGDSTIGMDKKEELIELQKYSFREHISMSLKYDKPLTIHLRDENGSDDVVVDALKLLAEVGRGRVSGSFHSYTLSKVFLNDIQALGFKIGFNGIITYNSAENVRDILRDVPMRNLLIESDAPYLPPQIKRKEKKGFKHGEPADLVEIANKVADLKYLTYEQVIQETSENYLQLFG